MHHFLVRLLNKYFSLLIFVGLFSIRILYLFLIQPGNAPDEIGHMIMTIGFANGEYINLQESMRLTQYPYSVYNPLGYFPSAFALWAGSFFNRSLLTISDPFFFTSSQVFVSRLGMQAWTISFLGIFLSLIRNFSFRTKTALLCGVALIPQLVFVQSYVNLDSVGLTVFLYQLWAIKRSSKGHLAFSSLLLSCCKMNFYCLGIIPVGFLFFKHRGALFLFLKEVILLVGLPFLLGSFWLVFSYVMNTREYGTFLGFNALSQIYQSSEVGGFRVFSLNFINISLASAFGRFGWMSVRFPEIIYFVWRVIFLPAGLFSICRHFSDSQKKLQERQLTFIALAVVFLNLLIHFWASFNNAYQPQGRYILPAIMILQSYLAVFLSGIYSNPKQKKWLVGFCLFMSLTALGGLILARESIPNPPGLLLETQ